MMDMVSKFKFITGNEIDNALEKKYRVYMCGNLTNAQEELDCIPDEKLEIGTSFYKRFTSDKPHFHAQATEYNYVVQGTVKLLLIGNNHEFEFEEGSIFVIPPNTRYVTKNQKSTRLFFVKSPGGNDKKLVDVNQKVIIWMKSWN